MVFMPDYICMKWSGTLSLSQPSEAQSRQDNKTAQILICKPGDTSLPSA